MAKENKTISVNAGSQKQFFHKRTGKRIKLVREITGSIEEVCEECGLKHKEYNYKYRLDRRYKPENVEERISPPKNVYLPVFTEVIE